MGLLADEENEENIYKLKSGFEMDIFNFSEFLSEVKEAIDDGDFKRLYSLKSRCTIHVSFMKGWGKASAQILFNLYF